MVSFLSRLAPNHQSKAGGMTTSTPLARLFHFSCQSYAFSPLAFHLKFYQLGLTTNESMLVKSKVSTQI